MVQLDNYLNSCKEDYSSANVCSKQRRRGGGGGDFLLRPAAEDSKRGSQDMLLVMGDWNAKVGGQEGAGAAPLENMV